MYKFFAIIFVAYATLDLTVKNQCESSAINIKIEIDLKEVGKLDKKDSNGKDDSKDEHHQFVPHVDVKCVKCETDEHHEGKLEDVHFSLEPPQPKNYYQVSTPLPHIEKEEENYYQLSTPVPHNSKEEDNNNYYQLSTPVPHNTKEEDNNYYQVSTPVPHIAKEEEEEDNYYRPPVHSVSVIGVEPKISKCPEGTIFIYNECRSLGS